MIWSREASARRAAQRESEREALVARLAAALNRDHARSVQHIADDWAIPADFTGPFDAHAGPWIFVLATDLDDGRMSGLGKLTDEAALRMAEALECPP